MYDLSLAMGICVGSSKKNDYGRAISSTQDVDFEDGDTEKLVLIFFTPTRSLLRSTP